MPRQIVTRFVSTSKWWNPTTWGTGYTVWRWVWDMDKTLSPDEVGEFVADQQAGNRWKVGEPPERTKAEIL